jgi:hypothetical protein
MAQNRLKGSERRPLPGAKAVGKADPAERLEVSVLLRRRNSDALKERVTKLTRRDRTGGHLSREEFEESAARSRPLPSRHRPITASKRRDRAAANPRHR